MSIKINKVKNSTGGESNIGEMQGQASYTIPDNLTVDAFGKIYAEIINDLTNGVNSLRDDVYSFKSETEGYRSEINKQSNRNIEIIGIFSAVLALLIIDTSIIKSVDSFLSAILLIIGMTCSMAIFITLIHHFFNVKETKTNTTGGLGTAFWASIVIIVALLILGIFSSYYKTYLSPKSTEFLAGQK